MANKLVYNGIELRVLKTNSSEAMPVYSQDGCDYLYTRYRLNVTALVCRSFHSWSGSQIANPNPSAGTSPIVSTAWLRTWLLQKRRPLTVAISSTADGTFWAEAAPYRVPNVSYDPLAETARPAKVDAANGPTPLFLNIIRVDGEGGIMVNYAIEWCARMTNTTSMEQAETDVNSWPVIQSHRWSMSEDVTEDYLAVRIVEGTVEFRPDALIARNIRPDELRAELFHYIPDKMRRERIRVQAASDGKTLTYSFIDRQLILPGGPKFPFTRPEIMFTISGGQQRTANGQGTSIGVQKLFMMRGSGPPNVSRWDMLVAAVRLGLQHITGNPFGGVVGPPGPGQETRPFTMFTQVEVTYAKHERFIQLSMAAMCAPPADGISGLFVQSEGLTAASDERDVTDPLLSLPGNAPLNRALEPHDGCRPIDFITPLVTAALKGESDEVPPAGRYAPTYNIGGGPGNPNA